MLRPAVTPARLGLPCWSEGAVDRTIRPIAQVDKESRHRFLACHAPIGHIRDERTNEQQTDAQVFQQLVKLRQQENLVLVWGEPGTGKSHLINWLKLRYDHALAVGELRGVLPVLIQRRSGSLRDALEQLVGQLPDRFQAYLDPVRSAIERISEAEARQKLASALHLELGIRWQDRGKPPLHRHLRDLPEVFRSEGFAGWLTRLGGVIDRNIQRLVSPSDVADRESIPEFTAEEFVITKRRFGELAANTRKVYDLCETFRDEEDLAEQAAKLCNSVLRDALREVTGLGNAQLSQVFRNIRKDLKDDGLRLALFIEDVSTLSVLDDEVVNALEPQSDSSLCPLTAVLGMTDVAYKRLRDSNTQRPSLILSVGGAMGTAWRSEPEALDRFAARYLNAIRLEETNLTSLAEDRQNGADITKSACIGCDHRAECHAAFGAVDFDGVPVGLFPLAPGTASRLLGALDERAAGVRRTQRGFLEHLVKPVLQHMEALADGHSGAPVLALEQPAEPTYWLTFKETYAGGWPASEVSRLKFLAGFWTAATSPQDLAQGLSDLLQPFRLRAFTTAASPRGTEQPVRKIVPPPATSISTPDPRVAAPPPPDPKITDLTRRLDRWLQGDDFQTPGDAQELLLRFLRKALPLEDRRSPSPAARSLLAGNKGLIRFPGSATRGANVSFSIEFPRTDETRDLILALARHGILGKGSWNFEEGERQKRVVARWLRANTDWICKALDPEGLDTGLPVQQAVQFLSLAAILQRRTALPSDTTKAVGVVMAPPSTKAPTCLGEKLQRLWSDLPERQRLIREFLLTEIDIPQGSGGCVMIDPWPVVTALDRDLDVTVPCIDASYLTGHWKSRYSVLDSPKGWSELPALLEAERDCIEERVLAIKQQLRLEGYDMADAPQALLAFLQDVADLVQTQAETQQPVPHAEFDRIKDSLGKRKSTFTSALQNSDALIASGRLGEILTFDPQPLVDLGAHLGTCIAYIKKVREYVDQKRQHISVTGDPDEAMEQLSAAIDRVTALREQLVVVESAHV